MKNQSTIEDLLRAARIGDKKAQSEIFSKLFVRFLPIVSLNIQNYSILTKRIDMEEKCVVT